MNWKLTAWVVAVTTYSVCCHATGDAVGITVNDMTPKDRQIETDCGKINQFALAGNKAYRQQNWSSAVDEYTAQAAWSEFCRLPRQSIAMAYNNIALALMGGNEPLKARAWLALAPDNSKSVANLARLQPALAGLHAASVASPGGDYWRYAGFGVWSAVSVRPQGERWEITFNGYYMPAMGIYYGPNMGNFSAVVPIAAGQAVYRQNRQDAGSSCQVDLSFSPDRVHLATVEGDCGFGMNVQARGDFMRVSIH
ncbi:tetratricopeptide repeat protein [Acerihabitans sp. TG2]|uniref:tetratricopeptide repeat protein n=1 Tax=Acerihabitans sp. TG2 TaxID=3096008 RepID=UPI002B239DBD|nr:tetratricopeptide repeat protein [Acerihabitans sp. TG2]MEA9392530.1 tetratricopeptide repeat protein [Acerihabitans sp. TG2]